MITKFIIFSDARTGGTHITSKLNSHPDVCSMTEPFPHNNLLLHDEQIEWMEKLFSTKGKLALGFRTKIEHQANLLDFINYVNKNNVTCFSLQRRNIVKKAISRITGLKLYYEIKDYNRKSNSYTQQAVEINPGELIEQIKECETQLQITQKFLSELHSYTILYYEDLLIDEDAFFSKILQKLNIRDAELKTSVFKNVGDDLSKSISNYSEIKERLQDTPYINDLIH